MLYTVYGLHEAGKPDDIQYVGVTERLPEERLAAHMAARNGAYPVNYWVARVIANGKQVSCRTLLQTEDSAFALEMEKEMIAYFMARGGLLHNMQGTGRRRSPAECREDAKVAELARVVRLDSALAAAEDALKAVQAKIEDGSLNIQAYLTNIDTPNIHSLSEIC